MSTDDSVQAWSCPNCPEKIDSQFDRCWKCGADKEGNNTPEFYKSLGVESETESVDGGSGTSGYALVLVLILSLGLVFGLRFHNNCRFVGFVISGIPLFLAAGAVLGLFVLAIYSAGKSAGRRQCQSPLAAGD